MTDVLKTRAADNEHQMANIHPQPRSFEAGLVVEALDALAVAGLATLLTNAVPIAAGTIVLHEHGPGGTLGVLRILAFTAVTAGAVLLARP